MRWECWGSRFHPSFKTHPEFYVDYTSSKMTRRITRVSRFKCRRTRNAADPPARVDVIEIGQPYSNHNGGQWRSGPMGCLHRARDGGSAGDPQGNAQTALAARQTVAIDVSKKPYAIPADNPFHNAAAARAVRFSRWACATPGVFPSTVKTGSCGAGDVGQVTYEGSISSKRERTTLGLSRGRAPYEPESEQSDRCQGCQRFGGSGVAYGRRKESA
jgi:hypothetical protein